MCFATLCKIMAGRPILKSNQVPFEKKNYNKLRLHGI